MDEQKRTDPQEQEQEQKKKQKQEQKKKRKLGDLAFKGGDRNTDFTEKF